MSRSSRLIADRSRLDLPFPKCHCHGCRDVRYLELETDVLPVRLHGALGESEILG